MANEISHPEATQVLLKIFFSVKGLESQSVVGAQRRAKGSGDD